MKVRISGEVFREMWSRDWDRRWCWLILCRELRLDSALASCVLAALMRDLESVTPRAITEGMEVEV